VAFVDVKPGDRVTKGSQVFSHWESPETLQAVQTGVERARKQAEAARARLRAAQQTYSRLTLKGAGTGQELQDAEAAVAVRRAEVEAAELAVREAEQRYAAAEFEFQQAFVTSPIEGVVESVDVVQGERRQPGTAFRGVRILDPRLLQCRCDLTPDQLARLENLARQYAAAWSNKAAALGLGGVPTVGRLGLAAVLLSDRLEEGVAATVEWNGRIWPASVRSVGVRADARTGAVPMLLEVANPDQSLRCGVRVEARLARK
jgi:multidrug efflux pump subunit AcrA (membrane-fusion protein)